MRTKSKFKKQFQKKSRLEILKSWMTSFALTASAVIVAVTVIPSSPKAEINQIQIFKNQVVYQVEITDADNALQSNSLEIILENQFEHYSVPLVLGVNVGNFSNLNDGTAYQMHVMGDKGFGQEKLASRSIVTEPNSGGAILGYTLLDSDNPYDVSYNIDLIVYDDLGEYTDIQLYYGIIGMDEIEPSQYFNITVPTGPSTQFIDQIFQMNAHVYVYLEATLTNNETIILDELSFYTPLVFEAYYYLDQVTDSSITVWMYPDFSFLEDTVYEYKLKKDGITVSTKYVTNQDSSDTSMHDGRRVIFDGLKKDTKYVLEFKATYTNPYTLATESKTFEPLEIITLKTFSFEYSIIDYDTYYEVMISLTDPYHNFQLAYYYLYEIQGEFEMYVSGGEFGFTPMDGYKTVTFIIDKAGNIPLRIDIGLRSETNSYYYLLIDQKSILE